MELLAMKESSGHLLKPCVTAGSQPASVAEWGKGLTPHRAEVPPSFRLWFDTLGNF